MFSPRQIIEYNRKVYNAIARHFSDTREYLWDDLMPLDVYVEPGHSVLDLGCGNGRLYQLLAKKQVKYVGIDQSDELIAIAKKKFPEVRFLVADMLKTRLVEHSIDVIYCIAAFQHIPTYELRVEAAKEMFRVLKPGGRAVLTNWNLYSTWAKKKYIGDEEGDFYIPWKNSFGKILGVRYYHGFTLEELERVFKAAGFAVEENYYTKKSEGSTKDEAMAIVTVVRA